METFLYARNRLRHQNNGSILGLLRLCCGEEEGEERIALLKNKNLPGMQKSWHTHIFREEKMKFIDRFLSFENKLLFKYKLEKNQGKTSVDSRESLSRVRFREEGEGTHPLVSSLASRYHCGI